MCSHNKAVCIQSFSNSIKLIEKCDIKFCIWIRNLTWMWTCKSRVSIVSISLWPVSDRAPCQPEVSPSASLDPGLAPTWGTHTKAYKYTHTNTQRQKYTHINTIAHRHTRTGREREVWSGTANSDWRWQAGRFTGSHTNTHVNLHPGSICLTLQVVYTDLSG